MMVRHSPPAADTDEIPRRSLNRMTSDALHDPAFGSPTGHTRRMSPVGPMTWRYPAAKNPSERPSYDQNGMSPPVDPAIGFASSLSMSRIQRLREPSAAAKTKASRCPSGESASDCCSLKFPPAGGTIEVMTTRSLAAPLETDVECDAVHPTAAPTTSNPAPSAIA